MPSRKTATRAVVAAAASGLMVFAAGAGTSASVALDAQKRTETSHAAAAARANALYTSDRANHTALDEKQDQLDVVRTAMVNAKGLLGEAPWLSDGLRDDLEQVTADLQSFGSDAAPEDPLPKPRSPLRRGAFILDLRDETLRLNEYVLDYQDDHDATQRARHHVESALDAAKRVSQRVIAESLLAGAPVPSS